MGILYLPSLEEKKFICIMNISLEEVNSYLEFFDAQVKAKRKLGYNSNTNSSLSMNLYYNIVNLNTIPEMDEVVAYEMAETLKISNIPGKRGARAVFYDPDNNLIGVGTTVIYNKNWAMFGVEDSSIVESLREFEIEKEDFGDDSFNEVCEW